ncbi:MULTISPECIES: hypothetical protein [Acinetobacter]|uniref:hypothetical protein n=1 Tax=Acinetobacter TaxID=469 RepID=UPI0002D0E13B|nr:MULTISPECIES: hypothetical protein [Acinetobacter]ENW90530.1 hypothetical protein F905_00553 [Acinetobacter sp. CIP 53.82]MBA0154552.1 hypothetical protein [Acinetobacter indicus]
MRNHKLDQLCAKRLQASDFAKPKHQPLLTRGELITAILMILIVASAISYMTFTTYYG